MCRSSTNIHNASQKERPSKYTQTWTLKVTPTVVSLLMHVFFFSFTSLHIIFVHVYISFTSFMAVLGILCYGFPGSPTQAFLHEERDDADEWETSEEWLRWRSLESCGLTLSHLLSRCCAADV